MNEQQYEAARETGRSARRAGRARIANPHTRSMTTDSQAKAAAWNEGWEDVERARNAATALVGTRADAE